jgi:hypothetical protein
VSNRNTPAREITPAESRPGLIRAWTQFWFAPVDPIGFHAIRVFSGLLMLAWLLAFAGSYQALFGLNGWFDLQAYRDVSSIQDELPAPITWSALYLCKDPALLTAAYWLSVAALALFTLGLWPRVTAVLAWVVVGSFSASPAVAYAGDYLLLLLAFYLMVGYLLLGQWSRTQTLLGRLLGNNGDSLVARWLPWLKRPSGEKGVVLEQSSAANLALRLIQVNFAIVIVTSGLHKLQFADWWSGAALWYPFNRPFDVTLGTLRAQAEGARDRLVWISLATYAVLAWQLCFPLFAWRRAWRPLLLGGAVIGWLGSVFVYGEPLFGPVYLIAALAFLTPAEWRWALSTLSRIASRSDRAATGGVPSDLPVLQPVGAGTGPDSRQHVTRRPG